MDKKLSALVEFLGTMPDDALFYIVVSGVSYKLTKVQLVVALSLNFLSLGGNGSENPFTGSIYFTDAADADVYGVISFNFSDGLAVYFNRNTTGNSSYVQVKEDVLEMGVVSAEALSQLFIYPNKVVFSSDSEDASGLEGAQDFTANLTALSYIQRKYIDDQNFASQSYADDAADAAETAAIAYTDAQLVAVYKLVGDWDASVGSWPLTRASGAAIKRGDAFNVTVAGTIDSRYFDVGDTFYANQDLPGQTGSKWSKFEVGTDQGTESIRGTFKVGAQSEIENESTTDDTKVVTLKKFWIGIARLLAKANTWALKQTFTTAPRFNSGTAGKIQKLDNNKDLADAAAGTDFLEPNTPITPGTGTKLTIDAKGLVTSISNAISFASLTSNYTLTAQTALQKLFNVPTNGAVTLGPGLYRFSLLLSVSGLSSGGQSVSLGFLGTATIASLRYSGTIYKGGVLTIDGTTTAATVVTGNNGTTTCSGTINGVVRVSASGTFIPAIGQSAATAAIVNSNTSFLIEYIGLHTEANSSDWS